MATDEQLARAARAVAVLNGFWRRRDDARRDVERYRRLGDEYAVIIGSERTTAGKLVERLEAEIRASADEEREAIGELLVAVQAAGLLDDSRWLNWKPYDSGLAAWLVVGLYHAHVTRCGPRGWRITVTMEVGASAHHHITTADMFASMDEAKSAAAAVIYAHEQKT